MGQIIIHTVPAQYISIIKNKSMNPTTISIIRGTDQSFAVTFADSNGTAVDLTGQTVFFTVKTPEKIDELDTTDANAVIKKTITSHTDPTHGKTTIVLSNTDTSIDAGNYLYDLKLKSASGAVSAIQAGEFNIVDPVTNRKS